MASTSTSPQSSLGQLGKALLKFIKPILKVKAHSIEVNAAPLLTHLEAGSEAINKQTSNSQELRGTKSSAPVAQASLKPGTEGSGTISVKRDPSTPWVNVVIGLIESCGKSSGQARAMMGTNAYQAASNGNGALAKGTIGRMVDLRTIISEEQEESGESEPESKEKESQQNEDAEKKKAS